MAKNQVLFSGQGEISLHTIVAGVPQGGLLLGNTPNFKVSLSTETEEHIENITGNRLTDGRLQKSNKATISFDLENFVKETLALALYGTTSAQGTGTVSAENFINPVVVDQRYLLAKQNVSSLVITDSTGSPKTLPAGQYTADLKAGSVVFDDITTGGAYVQPFKAAYSYATAQAVAMFTQTAPERFLRFNGINTAGTGETVVLELYKVRLDPLSDLSMINDTFASFPMAGSALVDTTKSAVGTLGQFGRIILV